MATYRRRADSARQRSRGRQRHREGSIKSVRFVKKKKAQNAVPQWSAPAHAIGLATRFGRGPGEGWGGGGGGGGGGVGRERRPATGIGGGATHHDGDESDGDEEDAVPVVLDPALERRDARLREQQPPQRRQRARRIHLLPNSWSVQDRLRLARRDATRSLC